MKASLAFSLSVHQMLNLQKGKPDSQENAATAVAGLPLGNAAQVEGREEGAPALDVCR